MWSQGDLYLVGGGDPVLASDWWNGNNPKWPPFNETSFESLADAIQQAGVTKITGGVIGDGSRYDDEFFAPTWAAADHITQAGPIDALLANDSWQTPIKSPQRIRRSARQRCCATMLKDRGIDVGDAATGVAAAWRATIAEVQSQPLPAILAEMLTTSDNNTAEMVLKEIGYQVKGQGTRLAGLQVVMEKLAAWGVPTAGVSLVDGSGLSDASRLTCAAILGVLEHGSATDAVGQGMPVAGATGGTLIDVFAGSPLAGKLRGKTGTLNPNCNPGQLGAKSLGGYVPQAGGGAIEFVLLQNGECIANNYKALWDQLGQALGAVPHRSDRRRRSRRADPLDGGHADVPAWARCCCPALSCRCTCSSRGTNSWFVTASRRRSTSSASCLIDRGSEVGGGDTRSDVGVVATMLQVAAIDGGRFAVVTVGTRRFRVTQWLAGRPVSTRRCRGLARRSSPTCRPERLEATASRARRCAGLAVEMGDRSSVPEGELTGDPSADSFLLAAISPFGPVDQYAASVCAGSTCPRST